MPKPQMVDDPGTEQKHEQRAGHHRPAGAERDVAEHVQKAVQEGKCRNRVGKIDQPVKHLVVRFSLCRLCVFFLRTHFYKCWNQRTTAKYRILAALWI